MMAGGEKAPVTTEWLWFPADIVRKQSAPANGNSFVLLVLNQPLNNIDVIKRVWKNASMHIAVDGGANCIFEAGRKEGHEFFNNLQVIIGDLDSLRPDVRTHFENGASRTKVIHDPDQYSTDFGKAVTYVRSQPSPADIVAVGGLGGRVDQGLSQLHHLYLFQQAPGYADGRMYLVSEESLTFLLKAGRHAIRVRDGSEDVFAKYVGILPVKEPSVISTKGLEWDVTDWWTEFGGLLSTSNHVLPDTQVVEVETSKDVLFTIALRELA